MKTAAADAAGGGVAGRRLLSFEFVGICTVAFLGFCNVTVFYNLFSHLQALGVPAELRGLVVGAYSLTAMVLYLVASPLVSAQNAPRTLLLGIALTAASGLLYLPVHSFWGILLLRILNGAGQFCMGAGTMALFVTVIPPEKSGQAYGIYSVAILVGYAAVPALGDALAPFIPTPAHGYAAATVLLLPALAVVRRLQRTVAAGRGEKRAGRPTLAAIREDVAQPAVPLLLLLNACYFVNWSSLFFLFKGFALERGLANVGTFFSAQTALMVAIRLGAGRLFDRVDKAWLIVPSFALIAAGHLALDHLPGLWAVPLVGALFGVGLGAGFPAINGLMFELSPPRFRPLNANLMLFAVQLGFFLGPALGGPLVARRGYHGYFMASVGLAVLSGGLGTVLARHRHAT